MTRRSVCKIGFFFWRLSAKRTSLCLNIVPSLTIIHSFNFFCSHYSASQSGTGTNTTSLVLFLAQHLVTDTNPGCTLCSVQMRNTRGSSRKNAEGCTPNTAKHNFWEHPSKAPHTKEPSFFFPPRPLRTTRLCNGSCRQLRMFARLHLSSEM